MNIAHERARMKALIRRMGSSQTKAAFASDFDELAETFDDPDVPEDQKKLIAVRLDQLLKNAESSTGGGFWTITTAAFAGLLVLLFFGGITLYMASLKEPISSVRATRPILVFTLIVAMLGFGGLLMVRSLFGSEEADEFLERRFRLAREIFLVYAGIFGTIIGFYFGAADEGIPSSPAVTVAVRDHTLTGQISGGIPPFTAYVSRESPQLDLLMQGDDRLMTLELQETLAQCPVGGTVTVIDGQGRRASADVLPEVVIGWPECKDWDQILPGQAGAAAEPGS